MSLLWGWGRGEVQGAFQGFLSRVYPGEFWWQGLYGGLQPCLVPDAPVAYVTKWTFRPLGHLVYQIWAHHNDGYNREGGTPGWCSETANSRMGFLISEVNQTGQKRGITQGYKCQPNWQNTGCMCPLLFPPTLTHFTQQNIAALAAEVKNHFQYITFKH